MRTEDKLNRKRSEEVMKGIDRQGEKDSAWHSMVMSLYSHGRIILVCLLYIVTVVALFLISYYCLNLKEEERKVKLESLGIFLFGVATRYVKKSPEKNNKSQNVKNT